MKAVVSLLAIFLSSTALAQTSASHKLTEWTLNGGGHPQNGTFAASASYKVRLDAIGEAVTGTDRSSASHRMSSGFVADYPPPGEVGGQLFSSKTTLTWSPEKSVGSYDVYRAQLSTLPGLGFGACLQSGLANETASDGTAPSAGQGFFYLVTARNLLGEIGTKGYPSSGIERANAAPCP